MLLPKEIDIELPETIDSIHNYYEHLVLDKLVRLHKSGDIEADDISDVTCVALNNLPPRYVRYDVDMAFYLSPDEYQEIENKIDVAVSKAIKFVKKHAARNNRMENQGE
jgi:competence protein ComFB